MQEQKFKLTSAVKNNSARGTALLEKAKSLAHKDKLDSIKGLTDILKSESLSLNQVKELYTFLNKAQSKYNPNKRLQGNNLDADSAAFLAAGGSSGLAWSKLVLKEAGVLNSLTKDIQKAETEVEENISGLNLPIIKAVNEELMQALFIAMVPDEVDAHGDICSEAEVRKACHNFNAHKRAANLFHLYETNAFDIVESYITVVDFTMNGNFVKKGSWLVNLQINDPDVWDLIKTGELNGVSIGGMAKVEEIE